MKLQRQTQMLYNYTNGDIIMVWTVAEGRKAAESNILYNIFSFYSKSFQHTHRNCNKFLKGISKIFPPLIYENLSSILGNFVKNMQTSVLKTTSIFWKTIMKISYESVRFSSLNTVVVHSNWILKKLLSYYCVKDQCNEVVYRGRQV